MGTRPDQNATGRILGTIQKSPCQRCPQRAPDHFETFWRIDAHAASPLLSSGDASIIVPQIAAVTWRVLLRLLGHCVHPRSASYNDLDSHRSDPQCLSTSSFVQLRRADTSYALPIKSTLRNRQIKASIFCKSARRQSYVYCSHNRAKKGRSSEAPPSC